MQRMSAGAPSLLRAASALSCASDALAASSQAADIIASALPEPPDLLLAFYSAPFAPEAQRIAANLNTILRSGTLLGVSAEGIVGDRQEVENAAAISLLALRLPGVEVRPFTFDDLSTADALDEDAAANLAQTLGAGPDLRATILLADPFSVPIGGLLHRLDLARSAPRCGPIVGGLASAGAAPGQNALILNDRILRHGLVGVSLRGSLRIDTVVSQGCKPVGPNVVITRSRNNLVQELGGRPALRVVEEIVESLPSRDRQLLSAGLLLGRVIDERKDRFGRGDYLIRRVVGVEAASGALAVEGLVRPGQTVRLHLRDAETAASDLELLLDGQSLHGAPDAAFIVTCNARGSRLFPTPHHDALAVARAFAPAEPGEKRAFGGSPIVSTSPTVPAAGFFAAGEIGPIAGRSFLHGYTACVTLFRRPD